MDSIIVQLTNRQRGLFQREKLRTQNCDSNTINIRVPIKYDVTNLGQQYYVYEYLFNMMTLIADSSTMVMSLYSI